MASCLLCHAGACGIVDYSKDNYIAVNKESFEEYGSAESSLRPSAEDCGPEPLCPVGIAQGGYEAGCVGQLCQKAGPKPV